MRKNQYLAELDDEMRGHIDAEVEDNVARGMSPEEARIAALRKFGNVTAIREETFNVWNSVWIEQLLQDTRYAVRTLRRNWGFAAVVIATLGIVIGMNTAVFSIVDTVLFRPLPYPASNRLVWIAPFRDAAHDNWTSRADFTIWKSQAHSFEAMTAFANLDLALVASGVSSQENVASTGGDFWGIAGVKPYLGRLYTQGESNAIVLSYELFEKRFGGDPNVVGKAATLNGYEVTVTGVLPKGFSYIFPELVYSGDVRREIDAYIPLPNAIETPGDQIRESPSSGPAPPWICAVGKLRPGVSIEQANAEMQIVNSNIAKQYPSSIRDPLLHVAYLHDKIAGSARPALLILLAAVGFVLLIAIVNVANLLLSRASTRQREIAIRASLGAGRARVIRQFLAESILLSSLGGGAGLVLAHWAVYVIVRFWPQAVPRLAEVGLNPSVLLFTLAISTITGLLFGFAPAVTLWRDDLQAALKDTTQNSFRGTFGIQIRSLLVCVQIALAIVLLTGAGLLVKSFWRLSNNSSALSPESVLSLRLSLSGTQYSGWPSRQSYLHTLLKRLQSVPGAQAVGLDTYTLHATVKVKGVEARSQQQSFASIRAVSAGYLRAMDVSLIAGRWPSDQDMLNGGVLVNESFVRSLTRDKDIVGKQVDGSFVIGPIVGVVADFRGSELDAETQPEIYASYELAPLTKSMSVHAFIRMSGHLQPNGSEIQQIVSGIDPTQPVYNVETLEQALSESISPRRFNLFLLGTFATSALLMALIGIYGVIAYGVTQRTHEIGIRMALGADRSRIVGMVVFAAMRTAVIGICIGLLASFGLTRLMTSLLYNVRSDDPMTFAFVALMLAVSAFLASVWPATRAALINPLIALRHE
jgi:putative ABC transport system permease protein